MSISFWNFVAGFVLGYLTVGVIDVLLRIFLRAGWLLHRQIGKVIRPFLDVVARRVFFLRPYDTLLTQSVRATQEMTTAVLLCIWILITGTLVSVGMLGSEGGIVEFILALALGYTVTIFLGAVFRSDLTSAVGRSTLRVRCVLVVLVGLMLSPFVVMSMTADYTREQIERHNAAVEQEERLPDTLITRIKIVNERREQDARFNLFTFLVAVLVLMMLTVVPLLRFTIRGELEWYYSVEYQCRANGIAVL